MSGDFTVIFFDADGAEVNATALGWIDAMQESMQNSSASGDPCYVTLSIPYRDWDTMSVPQRVIFGLNKMWAGYRSSTSSFWLEDNFLAVAWVGKTTVTQAFGEIQVRVDLITPTDLLDRVAVRSWPNDAIYDAGGVLLKYHIPALTGDPTINGYPSGYTAAQWLVGNTAPVSGSNPYGDAAYPGVLPKYMPFVRIGDIDDVFSSGDAVFDRTIRPTNTAVMGHIEFPSVKQLIERILEALNTLFFSSLTRRPLYPVKPYYYLCAIVDPDNPGALAVEFRLLNGNAL